MKIIEKEMGYFSTLFIIFCDRFKDAVLHIIDIHINVYMLICM